MLIGTPEIAYGQPLIQDSCICYTDNQDKRCLECLINAPKRDSIAINQAIRIQNFKAILINARGQITLLESESTDLNKRLNRANLRLKISRKLTTFGLPTALVGGFFIGYLLK